MAKTKTIHIFLITAVLFSSACFFASRKTAMAYSECDLIEDDTGKRKCEALEKKAEAYRQIIELKQKQGATLNNQISIMNAEIGQTETEIQVSEGKIESFTNKIGDLENKIKEKEELIVVQKKVLSELIRAYYEYNQQNVFNTMIKDSGFSQFMSEEDRIVQIGDGVREMLSSIMALKTDMENNKKEAEEKKNGVTDLKYQLEESNADLEAGKAQKNLLLAQTQGDEARYQARLEKAERQKLELLGDIDILYGASSAELEALKASLPKPDKKYHALTSWHYYQNDSRWGNKRIGQSNSLIKDYGCALTDVAMIFTYYDEDITPKSLAKKPIYIWGDSIIWPSSSKDIVGGSISLVTNTNHTGVNWNTVDDEIDNENPVIVFVCAKNCGTRQRAGHYVIIHNKDKNGKYVVHDPYFGPNIYLDSTLKLLSKMYNKNVKKSSIDQMILYKD